MKPVIETALLTTGNTILIVSGNPNAKIEGDSDPIKVSEVESRHNTSIWDEEQEENY